MLSITGFESGVAPSSAMRFAVQPCRFSEYLRRASRTSQSIGLQALAQSRKRLLMHLQAEPCQRALDIVPSRSSEKIEKFSSSPLDLQQDSNRTPASKQIMERGESVSPSTPKILWPHQWSEEQCGLGQTGRVQAPGAAAPGLCGTI